MNNKDKTKNESKNSYLGYYSENLKFYFTGFCIATGIFIILFVLGIISFNKTPQLLGNPKTLNYQNNNAFGELRSGDETDENTQNINIKPIITTYPILYHIGEKQIPSLDKNYYIAKKREENQISINSLLKELRLPDIKTKGFKSGKLENILFKTETGKYYISIDLNHHKIEIYDTNEEYIEQNKEYTEKEIRNYIKGEISNLGLNLKYYGDPVFLENLSEQATIFYPRKIDDKEVWNSNNIQEGLTVIFNKNQGTITEIYNYDIQTYDLSKYKLQKTKKEILEKLKKAGNIDTTKNGQDGSIGMKKGIEIYLEKGGYLIPALLFKSNTNIEKNIITPLF